MTPISQQVLRTDVSGMPLEWIDYRDAVRLYHTEQVAYACGSVLYRLHGGINAASGRRSIIDVNSIIATHGDTHTLGKARGDYSPPLNNQTLFKRDGYLCMYCGDRFLSSQLSRNNYKAGRTPEQAGIELLAVPFTPTYAEYIYLKGRRVMADQMEYLLAHFPRRSPLHQRVSTWLSQEAH